MIRTSFLLPLCLLAGCDTHHTIVIEQAKPMEININFTGHLDLVIQDARQNLEQINGGKPSQVVRPEDIGLPSVSAPHSEATGGASDADVAAMAAYEQAFPAMLSSKRDVNAIRMNIAASADPKATMSARHPQIQALWDSGAVGESWTGLLVVKGTLTPEQQTLVNAENDDRQALYAAEAKAKNLKAEDVAVSYYIARLGYAKKGAWYEVKNKQTGAWEWKQWGS